MTGLTAAAMARSLAAGLTDSQTLVKGCLDRIAALDGLFGAIRTTCPDSLQQAASSDDHRRRHGARSPLEGVPVVVKDNIDTRGTTTTAGSLALADRRPEADAHLVARLRTAGAVVLAKTNLSELANFLTEGMPSGYSSAGGQVLNPYDLAQTPSGSSSGSGAAVALALAPLAVGTETDGSIVSPAVHQSLVGVKPSLGLVSRQGIFPIAPSQDTAGPMATTVADAAMLLSVICGTDPADPVTAEGTTTAAALQGFVPDPGALAGARLVVSSASPQQLDSPAFKAFLGPLRKALEGAGATVGEAHLPEPAADDEMFVLHYEFAPAVDRYFRSSPGQGAVRSLADIQSWNRDHEAEALKFGQSHVDSALALDHAAERDRWLEARRRDLLLVTSALEAALGEADALVFRADEGATWAARAGWPSVTVPIGYSRRSRRPLGLTLVARRWTDPRLLSVAAGVEASCGERLPPEVVNPAVFARLRRR